MDAVTTERAVAAATALVTAAGLPVTEARVLQQSNTLTVRLLPVDVVARVAPRHHQVAALEVEVARQLAAAGSPVATLDPRLEPRPHEVDGFVLTFWSHCVEVGPADEVPDAYAAALHRLHVGMRTVTVAAPHFTDRVATALALAEAPDHSPLLSDADRDLLVSNLRSRREAVLAHGAPEQLLHGEPHPGNLLVTREGLRFIDFETCCRGPVEFDLAHVPDPVSRRATGADPDLLAECRGLVLAVVAAWRWDVEDRFPDGARAGRALLAALAAGPPYPGLDVVMAPPATDR